jgi:hypothetical protein
MCDTTHARRVDRGSGAEALQPIERVVRDHKSTGGDDTDCEKPGQHSSEYTHSAALHPFQKRSRADNATKFGAFSVDAMAALRCCKSSTERTPAKPVKVVCLVVELGQQFFDAVNTVRIVFER